MNKKDHGRGVREGRQNVESLVVSVVAVSQELLLLHVAFVVYIGAVSGEGEEVEEFEEELHEGHLGVLVGLADGGGELRRLGQDRSGRRGERKGAVRPNTRLDL